MVVWVAVVGLFISASLAIDSLPPIVAGLLLTYYSLDMLVTQFALTPEQRELLLSKNIDRDPADKFDLSDKSNVVVLILDSFQADHFLQIVGDSPEAARCFDGFQVFPDTVCGYPITIPNVALLTTGQFYLNDKTLAGFVKHHIRDKDALFPSLARLGYRVEAYPIPTQNSASLVGVVANSRTNYFPSLGDIANLALVYSFIVAPNWLRRFMFVRSNGLQGLTLFDDLKFFDQFRRRAKLVPSEPRFKLYHTAGLHVPLRMTETLELKEMPSDRPSYRSQAAGILRLLDGFLDHFKRLGIYDSTNIIIMGDHGAGYQGQILEIPSGLDVGPVPAAGHIPAAAIPLLLVKAAGQRGPLAIDPTAISYKRFPDLIRVLAEGRGIHGIRQTFFVDEKRMFYRCSTVTLDDHLDDITEYCISGNVWNWNSWSRTGRTFTTDGLLAERAPPIVYGQDVAFSSTSANLPFLQLGWRHVHPGEDFVCSDGPRANLRISVPPVALPIVAMIILYMSPFIAKGQVDSQTVDAYCNDRFVQRWTITVNGAYKALIPIDSGQEILHLRFELPDARSPRDLGIGADTTELGLIVTKLRCEPLHHWLLDSPMDFAKGNAGFGYAIGGFVEPDIHGSWTTGIRARFCIVLEDKLLGSSLILRLDVTPLTSARVEAQQITVRVNDIECSSHRINDRRTLTTVIPANLTSQSTLLIDLDIPTATTLFEAGLAETDDGNKLGVRMISACLSSPPALPEGRLVFGSGGNSASYRFDGWGADHDHFNWTLGERARFLMPLAGLSVPAGSHVKLSLNLDPLTVPPKYASQRLIVRANDKPILETTLTAHSVVNTHIPAELAASGSLTIELETPDAINLYTAGVTKADDGNRHGFAVHWVEASVAPASEAIPDGTSVI